MKRQLSNSRFSERDGIGRSILRNAVRSWWLLKRIQEHEAIGIERDLPGFPDRPQVKQVWKAFLEACSSETGA
jgi:hypothetical protein